MRRFIHPILLAAWVNASAEGPPLDVETILANPLGSEDYRDASRCIGRTEYQRVEILDDRTILFHGRSRAWLNQLRHRCVGLRSDMALTMHVRNRVCNADRFQGSARHAYALPTSPCILGDFEAIEVDQIEYLKEALRANGQTSTVEGTGKRAGLAP